MGETPLGLNRDSAEIPHSIPEPAMTNSPHEEQTILVIEDETDSFDVLRLAVEKAGLKCLLRHLISVDQGVRYMEGKERYHDRQVYPFPSIVLLDIKLGPRLGFEFLEWLHQRPDVERPIVIMWSDSNAESDIARAYAAGANSYLVKPTSFREMIRMVEAIDQFWLRRNQPRLAMVGAH